ncbi:MAG: hypothetical protein LC802_04065 [Acidobacteria bacterium]|nr:hypothetical protein [Acidobacteriota bacterium]
MSLQKRFLTCVALAALASTGAALCAAAQSKRTQRPAAAGQSAPQKTTQRPAEQPSAPKKATARPDEIDAQKATSTAKPTPTPKEDPHAARYIYEFEQPDFFVYFTHIEHDAEGRGHIRFERRSDVEQITEPFQLSPAALGRVAARWEALKFLDSTANYQGERIYPSYGKSRLRMKQAGRERIRRTRPARRSQPSRPRPEKVGEVRKVRAGLARLYRRRPFSCDGDGRLFLFLFAPRADENDDRRDAEEEQHRHQRQHENQLSRSSVAHAWFNSPSCDK